VFRSSRPRLWAWISRACAFGDLAGDAAVTAEINSVGACRGALDDRGSPPLPDRAARAPSLLILETHDHPRRTPRRDPSHRVGLLIPERRGLVPALHAPGEDHMEEGRNRDIGGAGY